MIITNVFDIDQSSVIGTKQFLLAIEQNESGQSSLLGRTITKRYPFEEVDALAFIKRFKQSIFVTSKSNWDFFKNEMKVIMDADHMSNEQKKEAMKHLFIQMEKS
jgi:hypothetical protein